MAEITIEFTGQAKDLNEFSFALFETERLGAGTQKEIPDGGILTLQPMVARKAYGIPQFIEVVLSVGGSVAGGIAGNYIYDRLKHHKGEYVGIRINRRNVQFDKGRITRMINEEIRSKRQ